MKKVKLIKSIIGAYGLGHFAGEEIEVSEAMAEDIIQNGFGIAIVEAETAESKSKPEKAVKSKK